MRPPINYYALCGEACPGFDSKGRRVVAAWHGDDITADTRQAWVKYIEKHGLEASRNASHTVRFS